MTVLIYVRILICSILSFSMFISRTLEERAQRLFSTKGLQMEDLDPSMFAKSKPGKTGKNK